MHRTRPDHARDGGRPIRHVQLLDWQRRLSPDELYWAWISTQAITIWPEFIKAGHLERGDGGKIDAFQAVGELVRHSQTTAHDTQLKQAVSPAAASGLIVQVAENGCFCSTQRLRERAVGGGPSDACTFTQDVLAAAISLHTGSTYRAKQISSSLNSPGGRCRFELSQGTSGACEQVFTEFRKVLHLHLNSREESSVSHGADRISAFGAPVRYFLSARPQVLQSGLLTT